MKNLDVLKAFKFFSGEEANSLVLTIRAHVAVQKNTQKFKEEVKIMSEVENKVMFRSERFAEFQEKHARLKADYDAAADEDTRSAIESSFAVLRSEYYDDIKEHENKILEWKAFLEESSDIKLEKIKQEDIKNASLSKLGFDCISLFLEECV
jgi:hypothetical protein